MKLGFFKPIVFFVYIIFLFVFAISSTFSSTVEKIDEIVLADAKQPVFGLIYIASEKKFFEDENLKVYIKSFSFGREAIKDVLSGNSDLAVAYEGPFITNVYEGKDLKTICAINHTSKNLYLVVEKDRNFKLPQDLIGKKIIVSPKTSADFFLHNYFLSHGIDTEDIKYVDVIESEIETKLNSDEVDAAVVWNQLYYQMKENGPDKYTFIESPVYHQYSLVIGRTEFLKNNQQVTQKFVNALNRANTFAKENPQEAAALVENYLYGEQTGQLYEHWEDLNLDLVLSNTLLDVMNREGRWFVEKGYINNTNTYFDIRNLIITDFLDKANPALVTL